MLTFGFEREYFVYSLDNPLEVALCPPELPTDGGILAEARGRHASDPLEAAYMLNLEQFRMTKTAANLGYRMICSPVERVSRELRIEAARKHQKGLVHYANLYDHKSHRNRVTEITAGLHVSVRRTVTESFRTTCPKCEVEVSKSREVPAMFDYAALVRGLDERFGSAIKDSKRRPGFYEIKSDGRVEARSLPNCVNPIEVAEWLIENMSLIHGSWDR